MASIRFFQGATSGIAGQALIGTIGVSVRAENGNNTGVTSWEWTLESVPHNSGLSVGVTNLSSVLFTPDVPGCYGLNLKTVSADGSVGIDRRVFGVPDASGCITPASGFEGQAHNFGGQTRGWAGTATAKMVDAFIKFVTEALQGFGGDISGAFNNVVVNRIRGVDVITAPAVVGNVLTWNGTRWQPAAGCGGGGLTSKLRTMTLYVPSESAGRGNEALAFVGDLAGVPELATNPIFIGSVNGVTVKVTRLSNRGDAIAEDDLLIVPNPSGGGYDLWWNGPDTTGIESHLGIVLTGDGTPTNSNRIFLFWVDDGVPILLS